MSGYQCVANQAKTFAVPCAISRCNVGMKQSSGRFCNPLQLQIHGGDVSKTQIHCTLYHIYTDNSSEQLVYSSWEDTLVTWAALLSPCLRVSLASNYETQLMPATMCIGHFKLTAFKMFLRRVCRNLHPCLSRCKLRKGLANEDVY